MTVTDLKVKGIGLQQWLNEFRSQAAKINLVQEFLKLFKDVD